MPTSTRTANAAEAVDVASPPAAARPMVPNTSHTLTADANRRREPHAAGDGELDPANEPAAQKRQQEEHGCRRTGEADKRQAGEPSKSGCWAVQLPPPLHL